MALPRAHRAEDTEELLPPGILPLHSVRRQRPRQARELGTALWGSGARGDARSVAEAGYPSHRIVIRVAVPSPSCKKMRQTHIEAVYYLHDWQHPDATKRNEYERLQSRFPGGIRQ